MCQSLSRVPQIGTHLSFKPDGRVCCENKYGSRVTEDRHFAFNVSRCPKLTCDLVCWETWVHIHIERWLIHSTLLSKVSMRAASELAAERDSWFAALLANLWSQYWGVLWWRQSGHSPDTLGIQTCRSWCIGSLQSPSVTPAGRPPKAPVRTRKKSQWRVSWLQDGLRFPPHLTPPQFTCVSSPGFYHPGGSDSAQLAIRADGACQWGRTTNIHTHTGASSSIWLSERWSNKIKKIKKKEEERGAMDQ